MVPSDRAIKLLMGCQ